MAKHHVGLFAFGADPRKAVTMRIREHLFRYVDEFTWRLNEGDVKRHTLERLDSFIDAIVGKRLTYARLIAKY